MISDEPDEDADNAADEGLLDILVGSDVEKSVGSKVRFEVTNAEDWPPSPLRDPHLGLDDETLAWFKANHADWRQAMGGILRAWMAVRRQVDSDIDPRG